MKHVCQRKHLALRMVADRSGQITFLFGLMVIPILCAVGAGLDYGRQRSAKVRLDAALDASILALASRNTETFDQTMVEAAKAQFRALASTIPGVVSSDLVMSVPALVGNKVNVSASYTANVSTTLTRLMKFDTMALSGTASASKTMFLYTDLYMALDVSQSMGLASTDAGAKTFFALIKNKEAEAGNSTVGCVFGCHVPYKWGNGANRTKLTDSYETIAHKNNIELRIDVLKSSVLKTINTAEADSKGLNRYRMALYTMGLANTGGSSSGGLKQLAGLTSSFSSLRSAADGIDLGPNTADGLGDSLLKEPLNEVRGKMTLPAGDGSTQAKAKTFLFIVTDGLRDSCGSSHCIGVMDQTTCNNFKDPTKANVTIGVIYTTYLPILKDPTSTSAALQDDYKTLVANPKWDKQIAPALQSCSSGSDWYAEASDGPAIDAALAKMFKQTSLMPTLTN